MRRNDTIFDVLVKEYNSNGLIETDQYCNSINVMNTGTTTATVNGIPLAPPVAPNLVGDSYSFGGNRGEIYRGRLIVAFDTGSGNLLVVEKFYRNDEDCVL
jgi:hypothetical protein